MQHLLMALRKENRFSQCKLSEMIGISEEAYRNKELGKSQFKMQEMFALSEIFGEPIEKIFLSRKFTISERREAVS